MIALLSALVIAMVSPIKAVQAPYYGDNFYRTPPPDLPSLLLKERIVYLGMPLVPAVTELIIAELLYLQSDDPDKPIKIYINSTGTSSYSGEPIGFETEAFAIYDTLRYIKPPIHTICLGSAMGMAAMLLSAGTKGCRASLPHASIILHQPKSYAQGQATDIQIRAKEVLANKATMLDILAKTTGQPIEKISKDMDRLFYMTPQQAKEYGLIDRVLEKEDLANPPLPAGVI
jgi:ATP-dependent Clp protease protease subunit